MHCAKPRRQRQQQQPCLRSQRRTLLLPFFAFAHYLGRRSGAAGSPAIEISARPRRTPRAARRADALQAALRAAARTAEPPSSINSGFVRRPSVLEEASRASLATIPKPEPFSGCCCCCFESDDALPQEAADPAWPSIFLSTATNSIRAAAEWFGADSVAHHSPAPVRRPEFYRSNSCPNKTVLRAAPEPRSPGLSSASKSPVLSRPARIDG